MALYPYRCDGCGATDTVYQSIKGYSQAPIKPECCGNSMVRVITVPMIATDIQVPFQSTIDGTIISSKSQQREHMVKHGVVPFDDMASDFTRNKKAIQVAAVSGLKEAVIEAVGRVEAGEKPVFGDQKDFIKLDSE